jgi:hypothetical protein
MITQIKENKPEDKDKVLIGEIENLPDLIDGGTPDQEELSLEEVKVKSWKDSKVRCLIQETKDVP